jgi:hypothetical protein
MANALNGNTYYVDTVSSGAASCLESKDVKVIGIFYHAESANQHFVLNDIASVSGSNAPTVGTKKLKTGTSSAHEQFFMDLSECPIRFPNGIWISVLDSGDLTLILKFN